MNGGDFASKVHALSMLIIIVMCNLKRDTGVKKIICPGARDKLSFRQDKHIFSPNVQRTSKKINASIFFLDKDKLFGNRTSKKFGALAWGTSENF